MRNAVLVGCVGAVGAMALWLPGSLPAAHARLLTLRLCTWIGLDSIGLDWIGSKVTNGPSSREIVL